FANGSIVVMVIVAFSVTHGIKLFGLIASLGIGGLAIAFAAKNSLEQLFGSVVLYLDRPFVPGDYVTLKDGTFGRVESIGLRSSKIRTSGRGTLIVIPNNSLASMQIENYTDAKKVISLLTLSFYRTVPQDERSLMRQIILESTRDIYGIDGRNTEVEFRGLTTDQYPVGAQAQITFFLLGSEASSMEIRCQLLDVASQRITRQLADYGIIADRIEPTIYVDSPITV
ncbi:MAG: mechanosensitive ion channel domain-containing protein, partial [Cyanobacteria bacterium P01_H01_bin.121]